MSEDRLARAALSRLTEPGDLRVARLVREHGADGLHALLREQRDLDGVLSDVAERLRGLDPARELREAAGRGIRFVVPGDAEWPPALDDLDRCEPLDRQGGAPIGLWLRGPLDLAAVCERAVGVVGSRSATTYGADVAGELGHSLVTAGWTVVSGAAYGIDGAAHRGALAAGGPTVAVLACGVDRAYPSGHRALLDHVAATGLVASELPPGCSPTRVRFLTRNRLIAAMTRGTVVVEAAVRSGALNTANWAGRLGRIVMGVPGPVTSAPSQGVHELLRCREALLVAAPAHVLELVGEVGADLAPVPRAAESARDRLLPRQRQVLEATPVAQTASAASIARVAGLGVQATGTALEELFALGLVQHRSGGWRLAPAVAPAMPSGEAVPP